MPTSLVRRQKASSGVLLIFDLDGTLYRTDTSFLPAVLELFARYRLALPERADVLSLVGEPLDCQTAWLREKGLPTQGIAELEEAEFRRVRESGELFPSVAETLRRLRDRGHVLTICTNGRMVYARSVLDATRIADLFLEIRARLPEDVSKTAMVADLVARLCPDRAVVVGDRRHDIAAAQANGCLAVGAAYGYAKPGELDGADRIIRSFVELLELPVSCAGNGPGERGFAPRPR